MTNETPDMRSGTVPEPPPNAVLADFPALPAELEYAEMNAALESAAATRVDFAKPAPADTALLEELAEGQLQLLRSLSGIGVVLEQLSARIAQVETHIGDTGRSLAQELASVRRELVGDRKGQLARGLFNAVVAHLDALRAMRDGLSQGKDRKEKHTRRMIQQIEAVEITLLTALQGLGFREFSAAEGQAFSAAEMECLGYLKGRHGVVLRAVRPGFRSSTDVVRPAGVYIAEPVHRVGQSSEERK